jgi:ketosteroid isomerase-like protein
MSQQAMSSQVNARRDELLKLSNGLIDAFNRNDLDGVMTYFAPEAAVYDELNGTANDGLAAIRAAFAPQFDGVFGEMKFLDEDLFIDEVTGKVMASWRCTLTVKGRPTAWRGLDLLHWEGDKLVRKVTYAKARAPLFE